MHLASPAAMIEVRVLRDIPEINGLNELHSEYRFDVA
jgi:hypothetical protein